MSTRSFLAISFALLASCKPPTPAPTDDSGPSSLASPQGGTKGRPTRREIHFAAGPSEPSTPAACVADHAILNTMQVAPSFLKENPDFAKTIGCDAIVPLCSTPGCPGIGWTCKACDGTDFVPPPPKKPDAP